MSPVRAALDMARHSWGCQKCCCRVLLWCPTLRETGAALLPYLKEAGSWEQSRRDGCPHWVQVVSAGCLWVLGASLSVKL